MVSRNDSCWHKKKQINISHAILKSQPDTYPDVLGIYPDTPMHDSMKNQRVDVRTLKNMNAYCACTAEELHTVLS